MAKSPEEQMAAMIEGLEAKTGKDLATWSRLVRASAKQKHGEIVTFLKSEHGVGHGYANLIAHRFLGSDAVSQTEAGQDLVAEQYAGKKAAVRPLYDAFLARVQAFGGDIELSPKKAYVSFRRKKQFATAGPGTATRLDVGLNLKGVTGTARLVEEKPGSMCTHKVKVESAAGIDAELIGWVRAAYEQAG